MTIGGRIKKVRDNLGMSQVEFADKINVSKQTLYKYENDIITNIPSDKIEAIAKIGKVSPAYIMGWEDKDNIAISSNIANTIKKYRTIDPENYSYTNIAEYIGVSPQDVEDWENNRKPFSVEHVLKLAKALGISFNDLCGFNPQQIAFETEEDYISNVLNSLGYTIFYSEFNGTQEVIIVTENNQLYSLSISDFEKFKESIRDFIQYLITKTIKQSAKLKYQKDNLNSTTT